MADKTEEEPKENPKDKVEEGPPCKKCKEPMGPAYELDVPVIKKYKDTGVRQSHKGYVCRGCLSTAFNIDGKNAVHAKKGLPKGLHPQMVKIMALTVKGIKGTK